MAKKRQTFDTLSPDGFSRFFILGDILREIYHGSARTLHILDVGGGSEYMQQQLDALGIAYELTIIDIIERPRNVKTKYIQGDATAMEFADASFDVVLSTDVLEHIPKDRKQAFLDECLRVAKEVCLIAAPFDTKGVHEAEKAVNTFNHKLFGVGQDWLEEHFANGKPSREMFLETLRKKGIAYSEFGTQNITTWLLNTHLNLIEAKLGFSEKNHTAANRFYDENILSMNEFTSPTYRHFFIMYTGEVKRFDTSRYLDAAVDQAKYSGYISLLMNMVADRMSELVADGRRAETRLYRMSEELVRHEQKIAEQESLIASQRRVLNKLGPVIKLARKPIVKKLRTALSDKKE